MRGSERVDRRTGVSHTDGEQSTRTLSALARWEYAGAIDAIEPATSVAFSADYAEQVQRAQPEVLRT